MIFNGIQDHQTTGVRVEIENQKIKFRVSHFTLFAIVTAPITILTNWLFPPELILDVWAFLNPVNVATTDLVQLRIYALKANDEATKGLILDDENETESGRCVVSTNFVLHSNGKNLTIVLKHIYPPGKCIANSLMERSIPFKNIQLGGLGARCDFMFRLDDIHQRAHRFGGEFDLAQEGNAHTVEGINFTDQLARKKANSANAGSQEALGIAVNARGAHANPANAGRQQAFGMAGSAQGVQASPTNVVQLALHDAQGTQQAVGMALNAQCAQANSGKAGAKQALSIAASAQGTQSNPANARMQQALSTRVNVQGAQANSANTGVEQALSMAVNSRGTKAGLATEMINEQRSSQQSESVSPNQPLSLSSVPKSLQRRTNIVSARELSQDLS